MAQDENLFVCVCVFSVTRKMILRTHTLRFCFKENLRFNRKFILFL